MNDAPLRFPRDGATFAPVKMYGATMYDGDIVASRARYAKGKIAVTCPPNGTGNKTRAARLAGLGFNGAWSNRCKAYILSPAAAEKVLTAYAEGRDACVMTGKVSE